MNIPTSLTPSRLRIVLFSTLVLIGILGQVLFYLAYTQLSKAAAETGERAASAKQSENTLSQLQVLQKELEEKKSIIDRTKQVTANNENYAYQDRLVNDLTLYANRAGLTITNISFTSGAATPAPQASTEDGTMTTPGGTTAPSAGLSKATVDITLANPVNYERLLNFLNYIEQNLTKLKVSKVGMTKSDASDVTIAVLNLEVYVK